MTVIFLIYGQFVVIQRLDSERIVCKKLTFSFIVTFCPGCFVLQKMETELENQQYSSQTIAVSQDTIFAKKY